DQGFARKARVLLPIAGEHGFSVADDLVQNVAADANVIERHSPVAKACDRYPHYDRSFLVTEQDDAAVRGYGFEYERGDLIERFIQTFCRKQRNADLADQTEQVVA